MEIIIRKFKKDDIPHLMGIFEANVPKYFDPSEENDFSNYLRNETEDYFVAEGDKNILGCGGINYTPIDQLATLSWDMIHPSFHGKGIGKKLGEHRIEWLKKQAQYSKLEVNTSQLTHEFYAKIGFKLIKTQQDFWAKGFHLYHMEMALKSEQSK